ncbi:type II toxin-antitoxin system RelE/ParE family toxin [bacterium]|nr:type II toxin-antitoxin system RelE/ParE family toxin [bacterium]
MKFNILAPARQELEEAVEYYNREQAGLGYEFAAEVRRAFQRIRKFPQAWHPLSENTRRCRLKGFPFAVIYNAENKEIVIVAIMHMRRDPKSWRDRL